MKLSATSRILATFVLPAAAFSQGNSPITREGRYWVQTISGSVPASGASRMRVITEGNVVLRGDSGGKLVYSAKVRVKARSEKEAGVILRSFEAKTKTTGPWMYFTLLPPPQIVNSPEVTLTVPRELAQTWIETRGGNVLASDLDGELRAESAGGRIDIDRINAAARVRTGGGEIHVGRVAGAVHCYSGGGSIRAESAGADSVFETAGGEIVIREARGPVRASTAGGNIRVERSAGTVFARTAGGLIEVQQSEGAVTAESSGGAIQVNAAKGVLCESSGGTIRLRNVAGALRATTSAGSILAELLSGNRIEDSTLSTNGGDITVFIASNIPLTVRARNESAGTVGRIISDFPEIRVRSAGMGSAPVIAEGALNGGGPVLRIIVTGGTIYLRRER